jgi:hypothetical protein
MLAVQKERELEPDRLPARAHCCFKQSMLNVMVQVAPQLYDSLTQRARKLFVYIAGV